MTVYTLVTSRNEVVAKVIFLHLSVIHSVHRGGLPQCMLGYHPPDQADPSRADTPLEQTPPGSRPPQTRQTPWSRHPLGADPPDQADTPLGADTPREQTPPGADTPREQTPPGSRHPQTRQTPRWVADSSIRPTSGQYASYWNAFLYYNNFVSWKKGTSRKKYMWRIQNFPDVGGAPTPDFGAKTNY